MGKKKKRHVEWLNDEQRPFDWVFRIDGGREYWFYRDFPNELTEEELRHFYKEHPYLAKRFGGERDFT